MLKEIIILQSSQTCTFEIWANIAIFTQRTISFDVFNFVDSKLTQGCLLNAFCTFTTFERHRKNTYILFIGIILLV